MSVAVAVAPWKPTKKLGLELSIIVLVIEVSILVNIYKYRKSGFRTLKL